jgi:hypothetical protein
MDWTETTRKAVGILKRTQTSKRTHARTLCQKKQNQLKLNINQLRWVRGLLTRHCHINEHHFEPGMTVLFTKGS